MNPPATHVKVFSSWSDSVCTLSIEESALSAGKLLLYIATWTVAVVDPAEKQIAKGNERIRIEGGRRREDGRQFAC